jgi:hypothetical protein
MITGFNIDVTHEDRVFHVQTEDKGRDNPIVESLIYSAGEIVDSRQSSYADLLEADEYSEQEILRRMEGQHKAMIRDILNGMYDDGGPKPFGHSIITNRSLDEVVIDFLEQDLNLDSIRLEVIDDLVLTEGTRPTLRLRVIDDETDSPVSGAKVSVTLISTLAEPEELFSSPTDDEGFLEASFELPRLPGADTAILCQVAGATGKGEVRQMVQKAKETSSRTS